MNNPEKKLSQIVDYIRGQLTPEENTKVARMIAEDPVLQKFISLSANLRKESATVDWKRIGSSAHALIDVQLKQLKMTAKRTGKRRGITIFDSKLLPLPDGVRPAIVDTRRVRFLTGDGRLDLSFYPISLNSSEVIGQYTSIESPSGMAVELRRGRVRLMSTANEFGLFRFPRIPKGTYSLRLRATDEVIAEIDFEI